MSLVELRQNKIWGNPPLAAEYSEPARDEYNLCCIGDFIAVNRVHQNALKQDVHKHSFWEITYCTRGKGSFRMGENDIEFDQNDIICIPPDIAHESYSKSGYWSISISVGFLNSSYLGLPKFHDTPEGDMHHIFMQIYREYQLKRNNWYGIIESLLNVLSQYIAADYPIIEKNPYVAYFENLLQTNISTKHFNLNDALKSVPFSDDHFRKVFKKETGLAPLEYLMNLRVNHAKHLLLGSHSGSSVTVREIADMVGFDDPYYFSRIFKKMTGRTPSEWSNTLMDADGCSDWGQV